MSKVINWAKQGYNWVMKHTLRTKFESQLYDLADGLNAQCEYLSRVIDVLQMSLVEKDDNHIKNIRDAAEVVAALLMLTNNEMTVSKEMIELVKEIPHIAIDIKNNDDGSVFYRLLSDEEVLDREKQIEEAELD